MVYRTFAPQNLYRRTLSQRLVQPIIGTGWNGNVFPGATVPLGLVQLSPDTAGPPEADWAGNGMNLYNWNHCGGYHYADNVVLGFSHTHISGTGGAELGDILLMPVVQGRNWSWEALAPGKQHEDQIAALGVDSGWVSRGRAKGYCSSFSHQQETARAGYYSVYLQTPQVVAEFTATTRCGMHRYTFPAIGNKRAHGVILDLEHGLNSTVYHAELNFINPTTITGQRFSRGPARHLEVYFVIQFSRPFQKVEVMMDGNLVDSRHKKFTGTRIKAIFTDSEADQPLLIRVGISGTGIAGARKNLAAEIPHWNFDAVHQQAEKVWNKALATVEAKFPNKEITATFYTAAYHGMVAPTTFNDIDKAYRGLDRRNHRNTGITNYTTLSIWDIFRAQFPLLSLVQPHRTNSIINTLLAGYRQLNQHSLPVWPLWGNEKYAMTGFFAVAMIVGAYTRHFRGYEIEAVYAAMRDTALVGPVEKGVGGINRRKVQAEFRKYGYVPTAPNNKSVSWTLDLAYCYWCVGAMADLLGKQADAEIFYRLGQSYKNLFDSKTGFMRGKAADGEWQIPFRPDEDYLSDYTESDAWQATFNVMHDVQGLIDLFGGDAPFVQKLDTLFTTSSMVYSSPPDISGMVGQDAQGNEPSNHIPYLYPFAGAAWKTQYWTRKVATLYNNTPTGIPGNDDCGQLSSWFVLTALGFYPVNPATGVYVIGSPLVNRAKIHNPSNKTTFTIIAENNSHENMYFQSARLNGKELTRSWFTHADIVAGGELYFRMGNKPNKEWASAKTDRPPSGLLL